MANFGFSRLTAVAPYQPHWREARSAVGSAQLLAGAKESGTLAEAVRDCTLVLGTGTLTYRKPEQPVIQPNELGPLVADALEKGGRIALVFGPEKHGLTREDLSWCHRLVKIPTDPEQPSMNLAQAAAVLLYELATREPTESGSSSGSRPLTRDSRSTGKSPAISSELDILAGIVEEVMVRARYSPRTMQGANRHDLRLMLRRLDLTVPDTRRALGLFRRILWRLRRNQP